MVARRFLAFLSQKRARLTNAAKVALTALVIAGALSSCGRGLERAELVFINGAEPESLDPALITGQPEGRIVNALFEGLARFDKDGKPVPGVAKQWEISDDKRVYRFFLRRSARWSNGDPVTAHDFVRSWERALSPETGSDYASQLYPILNAKAYGEGELKDFSKVGVKAIDPQTLEVTLENPTTFFLDLCAFVTLAPVHIPTVEKYGDDWVKPGYLVSNGAYTLKEWRINDRIRLVKNEHYWNRGNVPLESIDVLPIADSNTAFNFYSTGLADLVMDKGLIPAQLLEPLKERPDFHSAPFLGTYFIRFNCTRPPFDDARVRRAFSMVVDKDVLVNKITRAGEHPAGGIVPPGAGGYTPPPGLTRNVEEARRLLAEAGFPEGRGFPHVSYLYSAGELNEAIAIELQAMFKAGLGVQIELQRQEWKVYLTSMSTLDYDLCRATWVGDYNDPNTFLGLFVTGNGNNRTGWSNLEYDQLIDEAARVGDNDTRFALFRKAEHLLVSTDAPICPLYFYVGIQLYDATRLGGLKANMLDEHPLQEIFWKKQ